MITCCRRYSGLSRIILAAVLMLSLVACATRPTVAPTPVVISLTAVQVDALDEADRDFALRLQQTLRATAGRANADVGQPATMKVTVRQRSRAPLPTIISGEPRDLVWTSVVITANGDGRVLYSGSLRSIGLVAAAISTPASLVNRVAGDIRLVLGLEGLPRHAIDGPKRVAARPVYRPAATDAPELELAPEIADPLLNGIVTPTTMPEPPTADDTPVLDISKPLLSSGAQPQPRSNPDAAAGIPVPLASPMQWRLRAVTSATWSGEAQAYDDEPCVVTIDTDCQAQAAD